MMMEDNGSVIDGVVDDDFLMMLDDEVDNSLPGDNDHQFTLDDNDLQLDLTETNHEEEEEVDDFHPEEPAVTAPQFGNHHHHASIAPPQRGLQRHFSEGVMPQRTFSMGMSQSHHSQQQQPQRGVSRHFSERISEPRRGVSRHFSERIPERIPETTPSFYNHHHNQQPSPPRSPVPNEINIFSMHSHQDHHQQQHQHAQQPLPTQVHSRAAPTFRVTPEPSNSSISLPDTYDLQVQYQRTLQRLGKSMRRTDATRSIVKRQRSGYSTCSNVSTESEVSPAVAVPFPVGDQVEEARRRLFQLTQQG